MKFARLLAHTVSISVPAWVTQWVDYASLKKIIKTIPTSATPEAAAAPVDPEKCDATPQLQLPAAANASVSNDCALADVLDASPEEVLFFTSVNVELRKVAEFFCLAEEHLVSRYRALVTSFEGFCLQWVDGQRDVWDSKQATLEQLAAVARLYCAGLQLENFAVINYCALGKILKKHDKATKRSTKFQYMQYMVNTQRFAHYRRLQAALEACETMYTLLLGALPPPLPPPPTTLRPHGSSGASVLPSSPAASAGVAEAEQLAGLRALQSSAMGHRAKEELQQQRHQQQQQQQHAAAAAIAVGSAMPQSMLGRRGRPTAYAAGFFPPLTTGHPVAGGGGGSVVGRASNRLQQLQQLRPSPAAGDEDAVDATAKRRRLGDDDDADDGDDPSSDEDYVAGAERYQRGGRGGSGRGSHARAAAAAGSGGGGSGFPRGKPYGSAAALSRYASASGIMSGDSSSVHDGGGSMIAARDAAGETKARDGGSSSGEEGDSDSSAESYARGGDGEGGGSFDVSPSYGAMNAPPLSSLLQLAAAASQVAAGPGM